MFHLKFFPAILLALAFSYLSTAQSFTATPTFVTAVKPASFFVFYNYTQLENLTDDTLHMRWVKTETLINPGAGHGTSTDMGSWVTSILDPSNSYDPANDLDSADFYLGPEVSSTDKFIFHLFPNLQAGNLVVKFKLFPVANPSDSISLTFDYTATPVTTGLAESLADDRIFLYPNPAATRFYLDNLTGKPQTVWLLNPAGQVLNSFLLKQNEVGEINCAGLPPGSYYLKYQFEQSVFFKKLIIAGQH
jgi:hypothetical protein